MQIIHLANSDFEFELADPDLNCSIEELWELHPLCLQLQFLPLLYANEEDSIAVINPPDEAFLSEFTHSPWRQQVGMPKFIPLNISHIDAKNLQCLSWGASKRVQRWAESKGILYQMPEWSIVQEVNSKEFSFNHSPHLPGAELLWNKKDVEMWRRSIKGKCVLKTCFGLSGRGHYFFDESTQEESIFNFCEKEWQNNRPLIAEPWVKRVFDFSTQWHLDDINGIQFVGATAFESNERGVYQATSCGPEDVLFSAYYSFLKEHKEIALSLLKVVHERGFFGYVGVDAFLYSQPLTGQIALQPVVEINGRQTMSLAALSFQRRWFPEQTLKLFFAKKGEKGIPLLPNYVIAGHKIVFNRQLAFTLEIL